jgi:hypothetical protein
VLLRKFALQTAAFAILSALVAGSAQAQTKTSGPKTMTTAPLIINLGTGTTPAAAGTVRQTFQTAALAINLGSGLTTQASPSTHRLAFSTAALAINLGTGTTPAAAGTVRQTFQTAALTMDLGRSATAASTGAQNKVQVATVAPLVMNFGSQPGAAASSKFAATTSPLVMSLK